MNETKNKLFTKLIAVALCAVAVCGILTILAFAPEKQDRDASQTNVEAEPDPIAVHIPSESSVPTPIPSPVPIRATVQEQTPEPCTVTEQEIDPNPYADLELTASEKKLLACMALNEARGESFEGQVAVVQVALNRFMHEAYSGSISDILLAPYQFSVGNYYEETQMEAVEAALAGEPVLDLNTDVVYFSTGGLTYGSYYKTIGAHVFRTYT